MCQQLAGAGTQGLLWPLYSRQCKSLVRRFGLATLWGLLLARSMYGAVQQLCMAAVGPDHKCGRNYISNGGITTTSQ